MPARGGCWRTNCGTPATSWGEQICVCCGQLDCTGAVSEQGDLCQGGATSWGSLLCVVQSWTAQGLCGQGECLCVCKGGG